MANALDALLKVLRAERLPKDYPVSKVSAALTRMGYTETVTGSHYQWRQPGYTRIVIKVQDKKVPEPALKDLRALMTELGLL